MIIFKKAADLSAYLTAEKGKGKTAGLVPTMGALHAGHLSLIAASRAENDLTVCSIFVNPTQFNNINDFNLYPVTIEKDIEALTTAGCDILFLPSVDEVYPPDFVKKHYELGELENSLEGFYRPGHFQGVCQVVERLINIVDPTRLYLGQKDYQQCMVVKKLVQLMGNKTLQLRFAPTIREQNGLAMSSRNMRLSESERKRATAIFGALSYLKSNLSTQPLTQLKDEAKRLLEKDGFVVDYVEIAGQDDLQPLAHYNNQPAIALIAATIDDVRLIDNMLLN